MKNTKRTFNKLTTEFASYANSLKNNFIFSNYEVEYEVENIDFITETISGKIITKTINDIGHAYTVVYAVQITSVFDDFRYNVETIKDGNEWIKKANKNK